jgi:hypothetical protein
MYLNGYKIANKSPVHHKFNISHYTKEASNIYILRFIRVANPFTFTPSCSIVQVTPQAFGCTLYVNRWHSCAWMKGGERSRDRRSRSSRAWQSDTQGNYYLPFFQTHFTFVQPLLTILESSEPSSPNPGSPFSEILHWFHWPIAKIGHQQSNLRL